MAPHPAKCHRGGVVKLKVLLAAPFLLLGAALSARAQLVEVSIQTDATFQDDFVNTDFDIPDGAPATINFAYNPQDSKGLFWQLIVSNFQGKVVVNQTRPLDISLNGNDLFLSYTGGRGTPFPYTGSYYENLNLPLVVSGFTLTGGGQLPSTPFTIDGFGFSGGPPQRALAICERLQFVHRRSPPGQRRILHFWRI
jgi:hypothetical protein